MATGLPHFPEFDLQPRETAPIRFDKYVKRIENMFTAMSIEDPARQKAMLLHYAGEPANDVYETLTVPQVSADHADRSDVFKCAIKAFKTHFEPQKCTDHLVYMFRKEVQKPDESTAEFYTRLSILARKCDFTDSAIEIKRQIIQGTSSTRLRRKAVEQGLTLNQLLNTARAMETADEQTSEMEQQRSNALTTTTGRHKSWIRKPASHVKPNRSYHNIPDQTCGLCGGTYPHLGQCPANGKECGNCGRLNHYAKVCRAKPNQADRNRANDHVRNHDWKV